ncbi:MULTISPECIES: hypothetical protein [Brucella]|uniref:Uncharacterized protein n=1 Tax=Brucella anthropi (strain ATCC 49188 / DSM 6882 / CCUG 24695 / JCM 21032 / LMG 3331 / NBRC 15819 / NCTC 12168 / Alc 37) TaxID=439375 RepID=A6WW52_BRUA4|nr:hypothetical protein [Brucella anthropi]ABS13206.1 hypothetical protein Oant_0475 [Brucella anthropi ATCC 49188]KAB2763945.1 hypothetical protein F9K98_08755 [Brucella anthropi]KAB2779664.1 hypothetical protein F9K99_15290 [Brucella anthropi]QQC24552.1 hypothetical protein I6H96_10140 [Brucella anthropi]SUA60734.1 Uncharacterised protein [Brucella anthropi]
MVKQFTWDPDKSQVFDSSYESQESLCTSAVSFSKDNGSSFEMNAPGKTLTLKQSTATDIVSWNPTADQETPVISVTGGEVIFDFAGNAQTLYVYNPFGDETIKILNGRFLVHNVSSFISESGRIYLDENSLTHILTSDVTDLTGSILYINSSSLSIDSENIKFGEFSISESILNTNSKVLAFEGNDINITNSKLEFYTTEFYTNGKMAFGQRITILDASFIIYSQKTSISNSEFDIFNASLLEISGQKDEDFSEGASFRFNFIKDNESGPNTSEIHFNNGSAFLASRLGTYGLICINGVPQTGTNWSKNISWEMTSDRVLIVKLR